jgi:hypothetical protein
MAIFDLEAGHPSALLDAHGTLASSAAGRDTPVSNPYRLVWCLTVH